MPYPSNIDPEVVPLCDALNSIPGVETTYSCSGHGVFAETGRAFHVYARCDEPGMRALLHVINPRRYSGKATPGQQGCHWKASATECPPHLGLVTLNLYPVEADSTDEAVLRAEDLIEEIRWMQEHGRTPRTEAPDDG